MTTLQESLALEALQNKLRAGALRHSLVSGKEPDLFDILDSGHHVPMHEGSDAVSRLMQSLYPQYKPTRESLIQDYSRSRPIDIEQIMNEVGALPADVAKMTEAEALAELQRLDAKMAAGTLSKSDEARLIDVELRMEQFAKYSGDVVDPNQDWSYYEALAKQNQGKVDPVYQGEVLKLDEIQVRGASYAPWILGGLAFLALAFRNKLK